MPAALTYPGVYIEEISSGVRTITGVATSIAAFVGRAKRGPVDKPVVINGFADFERRFGGLWESSTLGYAVRDFFGNGGGQAIIVRVYSPDRVGATEQASEQATAAANAVVKAVTDRAAVAGPPAPTPADLKTAADTAATAAGATGPSAKSAADAVAKATKDAADAAGATIADVVGKAKDAATPAIAAAAAAGTPKTRSVIDAKGLQLEAAYDGLWGNDLRARIDAIDGDVAKDISDYLHVPAAKIFNLTVRDTRNDVTEVFRNLTVDDSPRQVARVLEAESSLVRVQSAPGTQPTTHAAVAPGDDIWNNKDKDKNDKDLSSKVADGDKVADDGKALTRADFTGPGKDAKKRGLYALKDADLFNLLCIPPHLHGGDIEPGLIDDAIKLCADRRALLLIDPPSHLEGRRMPSRPGITTAVGRGQQERRDLLPAHQRAESAARRVDRGVRAVRRGRRRLRAHRRAARRLEGARRHRRRARRRARRSTCTLTDAENGAAQPARASTACAPSRSSGRVVLGRAHAARRRRLRRRVQVRPGPAHWRCSSRRACTAARSGSCSSRTTSRCGRRSGSTSARSCTTCSARARSRARRPREAYFVKCDSETTTQNDIDLGIVNILVGFAPLKPAEFVVIKIQQIAGQIAGLAGGSRMAAVHASTPQRFDPYKNFKFRVKWDGRYVAGVSKVGALKRTTEVVKHREGGDPSSSRKSPGPHRSTTHHARARRHARHRVRAVGQQGLELRRRPRRGGLAEGLPQGHHHRGLQRGRPARASPTRSTAAGSRSTRRCPISTPTPTPSRSSTSSSRTRAGSATTT